MKRDNLTDATVFCALAAVAILVRLICPTPNFHPVTAASLFAGFYFRDRLRALCLPLVIMTISDYFLGGYTLGVMLAVYGSLLIPIACRGLIRQQFNAQRIVLSSLASSLAFFVLTNAAVWFAWYQLTWTDLLRCYTMALPFFANAIAGDLTFSLAFFGLYALATRLAPRPVETCLTAA